MATMKQSVGALTAFSSASNLNSLANNAAKPLGQVDNSSNDYPNAKLHFVFNLAVASLVMGGSIEIYFLSCIETPGTNENWSEGINPADTNDVSEDIYNLKPIATLRADDVMNSVDITWNCNDLAALVGDLPPYWTLVVWNKSGQALISSGHTAEYALVSYQT